MSFWSSHGAPVPCLAALALWSPSLDSVSGHNMDPVAGNSTLSACTCVCMRPECVLVVLFCAGKPTRARGEGESPSPEMTSTDQVPLLPTRLSGDSSTPAAGLTSAAEQQQEDDSTPLDSSHSAGEATLSAAAEAAAAGQLGWKVGAGRKSWTHNNREWVSTAPVCRNSNVSDIRGY